MPNSRWFSGSLRFPRIDVVVDTGDPSLNRTVDGVLKTGAVLCRIPTTISLSSYYLTPKIDVVVDMGNPLLNRTIDGFLKIGAVGASKVAAVETYHCIKKGSFSKGRLQDALKKMRKEGVHWGTIAGVYVGMDYGMGSICGARNWKNAMLGGALTGALISAATHRGQDKVIADAITGGAVATAAVIINYLT